MLELEDVEVGALVPGVVEIEAALKWNRSGVFPQGIDLPSARSELENAGTG